MIGKRELGSQICHIELKADLKKFTIEFFDKIESEVNEKIRQALPITIHEYSIDQVKDLIGKVISTFYIMLKFKGRIKDSSLNAGIENDLLTFIEIKGWIKIQFEFDINIRHWFEYVLWNSCFIIIRYSNFKTFAYWTNERKYKIIFYLRK